MVRILLIPFELPQLPYHHLLSLQLTPTTSSTMKTASLLTVLLASLPFTNAALIWDGRFNDFASASDLNKWSWSNQVGPYQYYIHGSGSVDKYISLSESYKNPNDTRSRQGAKFTLDNTAYWNGQNMRRIELIPQTKEAINKGKVYYHFSIMRSDKNAPSVNREHQICFFESHFTELKSGWISGESGTSNPNLQWMTNQRSGWKTEWKAGVWHNVAYEIVSLSSSSFFLFLSFCSLLSVSVMCVAGEFVVRWMERRKSHERRVMGVEADMPGFATTYRILAPTRSGSGTPKAANL